MREEKSILVELKKMNSLLYRNTHCSGADEINEGDLTTVQFMLLMYLLDNDDKDIFQRDIEATFKVRRSTVTNLIQSVEKKGYIRRESVENDARLKKLCLTDKAKEIGKNMFSKMHRIESKMKNGIDEEKLKTFFEVIELMNRNLEGR